MTETAAPQPTAAPVQAQPESSTQSAPTMEAAPKAEGKAETKAEAAKEAIKEEIRRLKLKIDGKEEELPEDEVIRLAQLGKASNKRFEEAKAMRTQAEQFLAMLKKDPKSVLSDPRIGIDLKKFAEQVVWEHIEEQSLSPEQKRARDVERELEKYKSQEEERKKTEAERQMQALHERYAADYDRKISTALASSGLPKTPATVKRMAEYLYSAVQNGYDLEPSDLVEQVRKDYLDDIKQLFGQTEGDQLLAFLGEDVAKKLRSHDLKRLKATTGAVVKENKPQSSSKPEAAPKKLNGADWRAQVMREMANR